MATKTWTVTTAGAAGVERTLTHEQMMNAMFEAVHGLGFPTADAAGERSATREQLYAAA